MRCSRLAKLFQALQEQRERRSTSTIPCKLSVQQIRKDMFELPAVCHNNNHSSNSSSSLKATMECNSNTSSRPNNTWGSPRRKITFLPRNSMSSKCRRDKTKTTNSKCSRSKECRIKISRGVYTLSTWDITRRNRYRNSLPVSLVLKQIHVLQLQRSTDNKECQVIRSRNPRIQLSNSNIKE